jgi:pimeloyl-ACP methyl ester carboxylesterase
MYNTKTVIALLIIAIITIASISNPVHFSTAQTICNVDSIESTSDILPVILVHGYNESANVWSIWEDRLSVDQIPYCNITFELSDDECGTAKDHAEEIGQIISNVKEYTGKDQVNVVAHSKGGLDVRSYLADINNSDVKNLIMIGTPNGGGPLADYVVYYNPWLLFSPPNSDYCTPALFDLQTTSDVVDSEQNPYTNHYTIYGNWEPSLDCRNLGHEFTNFEYLNNSRDSPNDGIVPAWSSEDLNRHTNLGETNHCHTDLLNDLEYNMSKSILISG